MAWTDAARAASIAARRAKVVAGKTVRPQVWYHGTHHVIRGQHLRAALRTAKYSDPHSNMAWATASVKEAKYYSGGAWASRGAVYKVTPATGGRRDFMRFTNRRTGVRYLQTAAVGRPRAKRVPSGKGRAARGSY